MAAGWLAGWLVVTSLCCDPGLGSRRRLNLSVEQVGGDRKKGGKEGRKRET
jgi:hypothetical protein